MMRWENNIRTLVRVSMSIYLSEHHQTEIECLERFHIVIYFKNSDALMKV